LREREESFEKREAQITERLNGVVAKETEIDGRLAAIAGMTVEQAKDELLKRLDAALTAEQAERISKMEKDLQGRAKEMGTTIITHAIQRYAAEHTAETTIARIKIADEDVKGRIIGKEGRNIKAFEQVTGVDLLIDETPGYITISCFSGLRREMARRALETLIADGRIQPARIEEVMAKVEQDMDREVAKLGEDAAFECEVSGLHPQLLKLLGKLQYRTSYGQNVLQHTKEVAFLCAAMAAELGLDPKLARRCGLMHDIGKAIDHEQEGSHPELGYEALKRFGENEIVANAALAHHEGHPVLSAYTTLAAAADAISAARPGARSKNVENYLKRLEQIEDIACTYQGVQKAYAIQAGRELRVIVSGRSVPDNELPKLAHDIARRIEAEVAYPGEVKVTVIREMRHYAVAR
jgi:ribonuclease Y